MESSLFFALFLGAFASIALNVGKGIQKWKVEVLKYKLKALKSENRKEFFIWLSGALLTGCAGPIYSIAFKYADQPSVITSLGGVGLIGVLIFSKIVLKEHINSTKILGAFLIIVGTVLVNYFVTSSNQDITFKSSIFFGIGTGLAVFFAILSVISLTFPHFKGKAFAVAAGSCLGMSMILADVALVSSGGDLVSQFEGSYVYIAILTANLAFVITQFALMKEDGSVVIPIIHSMVIIISIVMEYIIYSSILKNIQLVGVAVIIIGVFLLTKKIQGDPSVFEGIES